MPGSGAAHRIVGYPATANHTRWAQPTTAPA